MRSVLRRIKKRILRINSRLKFENKINIQKDEWFFILPYGIGDFYLFLSLLKEFQMKNNISEVSIGLIKPYQSQLLDVFEVKIKKVVILNENELQFCHRGSLIQGVPLLFHPEFFLKDSLYSLIGYKGLTLGDVYKIMLNLPIQTIFKNPKVNQNSVISASEKFIYYNDTNAKVVLLSPHANSFDESIIPFDFWKVLNDSLQTLGYKVLINSTKEQFVNLKDVVSVDFSLSEAIPFVQMCKFFVGTRSGFCDLISSSQSQKYILYPDKEWYSGTFLSGSSLISMGLVSDLDSIKEFEVNENTAQLIINCIIDQIANTKKNNKI